MLSLFRPDPENPRNKDLFARTLSNDRRWLPGNSEWDYEKLIRNISPLDKKRKKFMNKWLSKKEEQAINRDDKHTLSSIRMHKFLLDLQDSEKQIEHDFLIDFYKWLLGKGTPKDKKRTPWDGPLMLPDVRQYIFSFVDARYDAMMELVKLHTFGPDDLPSAYIYFKFIVRGGYLKLEDDAYLADFIDLANLKEGLKVPKVKEPYEEVVPAKTYTLIGKQPINDGDFARKKVAANKETQKIVDEEIEENEQDPKHVEKNYDNSDNPHYPNPQAEIVNISLLPAETKPLEAITRIPPTKVSPKLSAPIAKPKYPTGEVPPTMPKPVPPPVKVAEAVTVTKPTTGELPPTPPTGKVAAEVPVSKAQEEEIVPPETAPVAEYEEPKQAEVVPVTIARETLPETGFTERIKASELYPTEEPEEPEEPEKPEEKTAVTTEEPEAETQPKPGTSEAMREKEKKKRENLKTEIEQLKNIQRKQSTEFAKEKSNFAQALLIQSEQIEGLKKTKIDAQNDFKRLQNEMEIKTKESEVKTKELTEKIKSSENEIERLSKKIEEQKEVATTEREKEKKASQDIVAKLQQDLAQQQKKFEKYKAKEETIRIEQMEIKTKESEVKTKELTEKIKSSENEIERLSKKIEEQKKGAITEIEKEKLASQTFVAKLKQDLVDQQKNIEKYMTEAENIRKEQSEKVELLKTEIEGKKKIIRSKQDEIENMKVDQEALLKDIESTQIENKILTDKALNVLEQEKVIKERESILQSKILTYENTIELGNSQLQNALNEIQRLSTEKQALVAVVPQQTVEIKQLKLDKNNLQNELTKVNKTLSEKLAEREQMEKLGLVSKEKTVSKEAHEAAIKEHEMKIKSLNKEKVTIENKLNKANEDIASKDITMKNIEEEKERKEGQIDDLKKTVNEVKKYLNETKTQMKEKQSQLEFEQERHIALEEQYKKDLSSLTTKMKQKEDEHSRALDAFEQRIDQLSSSVTEKQILIKEGNQKFKNLENDVRALQSGKEEEIKKIIDLATESISSIFNDLLSKIAKGQNIDDRITAESIVDDTIQKLLDTQKYFTYNGANKKAFSQAIDEISNEPLPTHLKDISTKLTSNVKQLVDIKKGNYKNYSDFQDALIKNKILEHKLSENEKKLLRDQAYMQHVGLIHKSIGNIISDPAITQLSNKGQSLRNYAVKLSANVTNIIDEAPESQADNGNIIKKYFASTTKNIKNVIGQLSDIFNEFQTIQRPLRPASTVPLQKLGRGIVNYKTKDQAEQKVNYDKKEDIVQRLKDKQITIPEIFIEELISNPTGSNTTMIKTGRQTNTINPSLVRSTLYSTVEDLGLIDETTYNSLPADAREYIARLRESQDMPPWRNFSIPTESLDDENAAKRKELLLTESKLPTIKYRRGPVLTPQEQKIHNEYYHNVSYATGTVAKWLNISTLSNNNFYNNPLTGQEAQDLRRWYSDSQDLLNDYTMSYINRMYYGWANTDPGLRNRVANVLIKISDNLNKANEMPELRGYIKNVFGGADVLAVRALDLSHTALLLTNIEPNLQKLSEETGFGEAYEVREKEITTKSQKLKRKFTEEQKTTPSEKGKPERVETVEPALKKLKTPSQIPSIEPVVQETPDIYKMDVEEALHETRLKEEGFETTKVKPSGTTEEKSEKALAFTPASKQFEAGMTPTRTRHKPIPPTIVDVTPPEGKHYKVDENTGKVTWFGKTKTEKIRDVLQEAINNATSFQTSARINEANINVFTDEKKAFVEVSKASAAQAIAAGEAFKDDELTKYSKPKSKKTILLDLFGVGNITDSRFNNILNSQRLSTSDFAHILMNVPQDIREKIHNVLSEKTHATISEKLKLAGADENEGKIGEYVLKGALGVGPFSTLVNTNTKSRKNILNMSKGTLLEYVRANKEKLIPYINTYEESIELKNENFKALEKAVDEKKPDDILALLKEINEKLHGKKYPEMAQEYASDDPRRPSPTSLLGMPTTSAPTLYDLWFLGLLSGSTLKDALNNLRKQTFEGKQRPPEIRQELIKAIQ
jgi:hypothetical protein